MSLLLTHLGLFPVFIPNNPTLFRLVGTALDVVSTTPLITADEVERVGFLLELPRRFFFLAHPYFSDVP